MTMKNILFCIIGFFGLHSLSQAFFEQPMHNHQIPEECGQIGLEVCLAFDKIQTAICPDDGISVMKATCNLVDEIAPHARAQIFKMALRQPVILAVSKADNFKRRVNVFFERYADMIENYLHTLSKKDLDAHSFEIELKVIKTFTSYIIDSLNFEYVGVLSMEDSKYQQKILSVLVEELLWINNLLDACEDVSLKNKYSHTKEMLLDLQSYAKKSFNAA